MNNKTTIFNSYVVKAILLNNEFAISRVDELESIKSILFDFAKYNDAEELIGAGKIDLIREASDNPGFREYLEIMRFTDQRKIQYWVTIYDSDELWQNPEVIRIFAAKALNSGRFLPG